MPVSDQHSLYVNNLVKWQLVRDAVEGSDAIKNRTGGGDNAIRGSRYLPQPNPNDNSKENQTRYEQYRTRANFVNFTGHTLDGFLGMVYREPIKSELPSGVDYLNDNADG